MEEEGGGGGGGSISSSSRSSSSCSYDALMDDQNHNNWEAAAAAADATGGGSYGQQQQQQQPPSPQQPHHECDLRGSLARQEELEIQMMSEAANGPGQDCEAAKEGKGAAAAMNLNINPSASKFCEWCLSSLEPSQEKGPGLGHLEIPAHACHFTLANVHPFGMAERQPLFL